MKVSHYGKTLAQDCYLSIAAVSKSTFGDCLCNWLSITPFDQSQLLKCMKIIPIFLLAFSIQLSAKTFGQVKITLTESNAPISKIFAAIEKQTGYSFMFESKLVDMIKPVSINVKKELLSSVLNRLLNSEQFTFEIVEKSIIIRLKKKNANTQNTIDEHKFLDLIGRVQTNTGEPIMGATIRTKEDKQSTISDENGMFKLTNIKADETIFISCVGYEQQSININGQTNLNIILQIKVSSLDETVVIAYGTTTKRLNTGNVITIKASEIEKQPVNNPLLALQGRVTGMEITQNNGLPGGGITVRIRGQNSISNGNDPLYIVNGVPYASQNMYNLGIILGNSGSNIGGQFGNPMSYLNPSDIESIEILKDADATAIYGSRGSNGVVLITTKKGKSGPLKLNINMQTGWGKVDRRLNLLNTPQYLQMRREGLKNENATPNAFAYDVNGLWDTTKNTDWQKELIGGTSTYNDAQVSLGGGSDLIQYQIGGGYHRETTVFPGEMYDRKTSFHFNLNSLSKNRKLNIQLTGNYLNDNNNLMAQDFTSQALELAPNAPNPHKPDGTLNWAPNSSGVASWTNPLSFLLLKFKSKTENIVGSGTISYKLTKNIELKSSVGYTSTRTDESSIKPSLSTDPSQWASSGAQLRTARFVKNSSSSWIIEPQINYNGSIAGGNISLLTGATIQQKENDGIGIQGSGFNSDLVLQDILSASTLSILSSSKSEYKYTAIFGRLNYNWKDSYIINLTTRRDGTSRFGPLNRFHNFWAFGGAWIFTNYKLVQRLNNLISYGKLRFSYGTTGSDQVGDYSYLDLYSPVVTGIPYSGVSSIQPNKHYTPDLAWEETKKLEVGIELGFLNDKIYTTASYYRNRSSNQLTDYSLPATTGFSTIKRNLDATVQNNGWEFSISSTNLNTKYFKWTTSINLSLNKNKLISVSNGMPSFYKNLVGHPLQSSLVLHYIGVDETKGIYNFADLNGNPTTTPNYSTDFTTIVTSTPKYYGGIQNSISFKSLQIDALLQFVKQKGLNYLYNFIPGRAINQPTYVLDRWQKPGDIAKVQRFSSNQNLIDSYNNALYSDQMILDASFIRLKNISISWQAPKRLSQKIAAKSLRVFAQGQNIFTISNYIGLDPETRTQSSLPPLRVITFGLNLTL